MDENCPFCKIIKGDIPSQKVYEDEQVFAILDINPARPGHVLVLPKEHQFILPLLSPEQYSALLLAAKKIVPSLHKSMIVNRVSLFAANGPAAGQQSPHAFIHLIPREEGDGLEHLDLSQGGVEQSARDAIKHNTNQILQRLPAISQSSSPQTTQENPQKAIRENPQETIPKPQSQEQLDNIFTILKKTPELHKLFLHKPDSTIEAIKKDSTLSRAFEGIDLQAFAKLLREQAQKDGTLDPQLSTDNSQEEADPSPIEPRQEDVSQSKPAQGDVPQAIMMSDEELLSFLEEKKQLKELIIHDPDGLAEIIPKNERLADFFLGTNPQALHERLVSIEQSQNNKEEEQVTQEDDSVDFDTLARHLK